MGETLEKKTIYLDENLGKSEKESGDKGIVFALFLVPEANNKWPRIGKIEVLAEKFFEGLKKLP